MHNMVLNLAPFGLLFRPTTTNELILGAVGTLQFDVVAHRLEFEYGVDVMFESCSYVTARWLRGSDADLRTLADKSPANMAFDGNGDYVYLAPNRVNRNRPVCAVLFESR